jgi:hypothetical protein
MNATINRQPPPALVHFCQIFVVRGRLCYCGDFSSGRLLLAIERRLVVARGSFFGWLVRLSRHPISRFLAQWRAPPAAEKPALRWFPRNEVNLARDIGQPRPIARVSQRARAGSGSGHDIPGPGASGVAPPSRLTIPARVRIIRHYGTRAEAFAKCSQATNARPSGYSILPAPPSQSVLVGLAANTMAASVVPNFSQAGETLRRSVRGAMDRQVLLRRLAWAVRAGELDPQLEDMERSPIRYPPRVRAAVGSGLRLCAAQTRNKQAQETAIRPRGPL